jgi:hypothetical protein
VKRMLVPAAVAVLSMFLAAACGGGGGDDVADAAAGGAAHDGGLIDASSGTAADAAGGADASADADPGVNASALGRPCVGAGQGDCPDGYDCIPGESGPWCTLRCENQNDTSCSVGYEGPGQPACILTVTINDETFRACSVVCEVTDDRFDEVLCPNANCDGTCPGELACSGRINDLGSGNQIGSACE